MEMPGAMMNLDLGIIVLNASIIDVRKKFYIMVNQKTMNIIRSIKI